MKIFSLLLLVMLGCLASISTHAQAIVKHQKDTTYIGRISDAEAIDLIRRYKRKRYNRVRKFPLVGTRYDSRTFWYSLDDLESMVKEARSSQIGGTGIRIYFGVYPKGTVGSRFGEDLDYSKRHTLLFVPTRESRCGKEGQKCHLDVTYPEKTSNDSSVVLLNQFIYTKGRKSVDNHGEICPPPNTGCQGALLLNKADQ